MSFNTAETHETPRPLGGAWMQRTQQTLLFPSLLKQADQHERLSVLEIGLALPDTVDFFSRYRCRVFFAAMYSDPVLDLQLGDISEAQLVDHFRKSFNFPGGLRFDLCLFWDFLNYLDDRALRAFNTAIEPYLQDSTRAHAFTVRTLQTQIANQRYAVNREDLFSVRQTQNLLPAYTGHSGQFADLF